MKKNIEKMLQKTKQASFQVARLTSVTRKSILLDLAKELRRNQKEIFAANVKDVKTAISVGKINAFIERLTLTEKGFKGILSQLQTVANMQNVLGEIIDKKTLANGISLKKIRFPLGVIFMIYESRPNVTIDTFGLSLKSGNAVILKGGKESMNTNKVFLSCIHKVLKKYGVSENAATLLENTNHEDIAEILTKNDFIDVVIPRGSYELTTAVAKNSRIPILYHAAGGARAYVDKSANVQMAIDLIVNAKVQRNSVCNALDCIVIHKDIVGKVLGKLAHQLIQNNVEIRADDKAMAIIRDSLKRHAELVSASSKIITERSRNKFGMTNIQYKLKLASEKDFSTEFLDAIIAIKIVDSADDAIAFIKKQSHHHTEMLIARDKTIVEKFISEIDAATLMINCSSRLNDGGEFGMGAEIGTATGKLHARGPVGVKELTTYKWIALGNGQIKR